MLCMRIFKITTWDSVISCSTRSAGMLLYYFSLGALLFAPPNHARHRLPELGVVLIAELIVGAQV